jgi:hypothetical protein
MCVVCRTIVAEAEEASIGIYGKPMSIKEQQVREPFSFSVSVHSFKQLHPSWY